MPFYIFKVATCLLNLSTNHSYLGWGGSKIRTVAVITFAKVFHPYIKPAHERVLPDCYCKSITKPAVVASLQNQEFGRMYLTATCVKLTLRHKVQCLVVRRVLQTSIVDF